MLIRCSSTIFLIAVTVLFLSSCASNSVLTLMEASQHGDLIVPSPNVTQQELKGRAFHLGEIYLDSGVIVQAPMSNADNFIRKLIRQQVQKGFMNAEVENGNTPAHVVNIVIEEMKFTKGKFLIPDPSILRVSIEVRSVDDRIIMKGELESRYLPTIPIVIPGAAGVLPISQEGQEWTALMKMIPAVAVAITKTIVGLQQGMELGKIEIYPDARYSGGLIMPDLFLIGSPFGISQLTMEDLKNASQAEQ